MKDNPISLCDERTNKSLCELYSWQREHDAEVRQHFAGILVLAGALASFSMPLLAATILSPIIRIFVALALLSFLSLIVAGICHIAWLHRDTRQALADLKASLKTNDQEALARYRAREKKIQDEKMTGDVFGVAVYTLFVVGAMFLISCVISILFSDLGG